MGYEFAWIPVIINVANTMGVVQIRPASTEEEPL